MEKLSRYILTMLMMTVVSGLWAADETIDLTAQGFTNGQIVTTVNGTNVTLTFDKGGGSTNPTYYNTGTAVRLYNNGILTVSSTNTITKIVFTFGNNKNDLKLVSDQNGNFSNGKWNGSSTSIQFKAGANQAYIQKVVVTYTDDTLQQTTLSFGEEYDEQTITAYMGQIFESPTAMLTPAVPGAIITYSSSKEDVATVNQTTGAVTFGSIEGLTTITATYDGNEEYSGATASYSIQLKKSIPEGGVVFDDNYDSFQNLKSGSYTKGDIVLIGSDNNSYTFNTTNAMKGKSNERGVNIQIQKECSLTSPAFSAFKTSGYNVEIVYYSLSAIKLSSGILNATGEACVSGGSLKSTELDIIGDAPFTVTASDKNALYLYKIIITPIVVEKEDVTLTIGNTHYATLYYSDRALTVPTDVRAETYKVANGALTVGKTYYAGETVPAGEAIVVHSTNTGDIVFTVSNETVEKDADNMLRGFDTTATTIGDDTSLDYKFYMLSLKNGSTDPETVGFYWGSADGAAFQSGAHKAYLAVPVDQTGGAKGFSFNGDATDIEVFETLDSTADPKIYDLQGRHVQNPAKGLYIVNGRKRIVR